PALRVPAHRAHPPTGQVAQHMPLKSITLARLQDRPRLLASVDRFRRETDALVSGAGVATERALDMLTSSRVLQALDVEKEDPKLRDRYGRGSLKNVDDG